MAPRLMLIAHAATSATRRAAFPTDEAVERLDEIGPARFRAGLWLSAPELRCRQTAEALGHPARVVDGFADLDAGRWAGADLGELMAAEPAAVMAWMTDAAAAPHGGESMQDLIKRTGTTLDRGASDGNALDDNALDDTPWPDGLSVVVAAPLVIRAALVHLLAAPSSLLFAVDIEPLSATLVTGHRDRWKLRALLPWGRWGLDPIPALDF